MKKLVIIQGGIRNNGTSNTLAQACIDPKKFASTLIPVRFLVAHIERYKDVLNDAEVILFVVPCYVNTLPYSDMLALELLQNLKLENKQCYVIAQGGMPYPQVHHNCVDVIALFAKAQGWTFQGSMIIGIGPIINGSSLDNVPWYGKRIKKLVRVFQSYMQQGSSVAPDFQNKVDLHIPLMVYALMAKVMYHSIRKKHKQWGYDPYRECPYANEVIK